MSCIMEKTKSSASLEEARKKFQEAVKTHSKFEVKTNGLPDVDLKKFLGCG